MGNTRESLSAKWLVPALLFLAAAVVTPVFWLTDLDLRASGFFFEPGSANGGWWAKKSLWERAFYNAPPVFVGALMFGAMAFLIVAERRKRAGREWLRANRSGLLLVFSLLLGPGLVVNAVFKNHWGRPRPNNVAEFGGIERYRPPLLKGEAGMGKSFPAGHPSVVFVCAAVLPLWRRRRPGLAWTGFAVSTLAGAGMGVARMAAGAHFLSDVLWSAILSWGSVWFVYYFVVGRCAESTVSEAADTAHAGRGKRWKRVLLGVGFGGAVAWVLTATPVRRESRFDWPEQQPAPGEILIVAPGATVRVCRAAEGPRSMMQIRQMLQGFGLPGNRLKVRMGQGPDAGSWRYDGRPQGFFTEIENAVLVTVDPAMAAVMRVEVGKGGQVVFESKDLAALVKADVPVRFTEGGALD